MRIQITIGDLWRNKTTGNVVKVLGIENITFRQTWREGKLVLYTFVDGSTGSARIGEFRSLFQKI